MVPSENVIAKKIKPAINRFLCLPDNLANNEAKKEDTTIKSDHNGEISTNELNKTPDTNPPAPAYKNMSTKEVIPKLYPSNLNENILF